MWIWQLFGQGQRELPSITYSEFYTLAGEGKVAAVTISGQSVSGRLVEQQQIDNRTIREFRTTLPSRRMPSSSHCFATRRWTSRSGARSSLSPSSSCFSLLPWVLIIAAWLWLSRRIQRMSPGGPLSGILKSRPRRFEVKENVRVRFDDVAGLNSAKQDLQEIVDFLREPERFRRLGGKVPRGVLLVGPPGTGKTLVARAVAGESGVPFFSINGSEFIELFVGVGASRVRELFDEAKKSGAGHHLHRRDRRRGSRRAGPGSAGATTSASRR